MLVSNNGKPRVNKALSLSKSNCDDFDCKNVLFQSKLVPWSMAGERISAVGSLRAWEEGLDS